MNTRSIPCLVALACWTAPLTADVLDDAGLKLSDLLARRATDPSFSRDERPEPLAGIPLSPEHEAEILAAEKPDHPGYDRHALRAGLLESRGEFAKALELARAERRVLDQARLLLRAGRAEEAAAALAGMEAAKPGARRSMESARGQVIAACRPLEDIGQWDLLESYLEILRKHLPAPRWQAAIWLEQLDIAYHRERLPEMKAAAGEDKLRLSLYHRQIGETDESERLLAELASDPARVSELLAIVPQSNTLRGAAFAHWQNKELGPDERRQLWEQLNELPSTAGFGGVFLAWLASGEDATPLLDTIAKAWALTTPASDSPERSELLEAMLHRYPDDNRFRFLVARFIMESDPARAAELFAAMASAAPRAGLRVRLPEVYPVDLRTIRDQLNEDPALLGFAGLASLNRQDKAKEIIGSNKTWPGLPAVDRARYLAAANLDHDLVALAMEADYSLPENDGLAEWLAAVLRERARERVIPPALYSKIAARLSEMVLGSTDKEQLAVGADAAAFVRLLGDSPLELADLRAAVHRMSEAAAARRAELKASLAQDVASGAFGVPRLKGVFPYPAGKEPVKLGVNTPRLEELNAYLTLLTPPRIQRIPTLANRNPSRGRGFQGGFAPHPQFAPPQALQRWSDSLPMTGNRWAEKPELLIGMMKNFPAGHPRRIMAELFIATNQIPCPDEAFKKECTATMDALVTGKLNLPGTDLFRYLSLSARGGGDEPLLALLDKVLKEPPAVRSEFLAGVYLDSRGNAQALARKVLSNYGQRPKPERQERDPDSLKLQELNQNGLGASPEALRLARVLLDRALDKQIEAMRTAEDVKRQQLSYGSLSDLSTPLRALEQAAQLDGWLEDATRKLRGSGMMEVEVLRILQQLDRYRTRREGDVGSAYARRIFDLDPRDQESARVVLTAALADRDRELVLRCLRALGLSAFGRGNGERHVLSLFAGGQEGLLLEVIEGSGPSRAYLDNKTAERLHAFFLAGDKALAKRFRAWIGQSRMNQAEYRAAFGRQLLAAGDEEGVVELYAQAFVVARDFDGAPWVFPPKPGGGRGSRVSSAEISRMAPDVQFMSEHDLTARVLALMEKSGQPEGIESATLRLAAQPDRETFGKSALPLLERLEPNSRGRVLAEWVELFANMPAATGLHLRILEEQIGMSGAGAYQLGPAIREAARMPGGGILLAKAWKRLAEDMRVKDPNFGDGADHVGREIFSAMIELGDKATWDEYWKWRQADGQPLLQSNNWREWAGMDGDLAPERLKEVLPRILREAKGAENVQATPVWVGTAIETGDPELIRLAKEALPERFAKFGTLCDLALGNPEGLAPYVGAFTDDDGGLTVWWNLVSMPDPQGMQSPEIPVAPFPKLDGKFELQVLGGAAPDKLSTLETLRAAPACGSVRLKLDKEVQHIGLLVTQPGGGVVRMAPTVGRKPSSGGEPVDLRGEVLAKKGFIKMARPGPGGLPAWKIKAGGDSRIDLAEIPWDGGGQVRLRGWVTGGDYLGLVCYDARGAVVDTIHLGSSGDSLLPVWRLLELDLPKSQQVPATTVRMMLAVLGDRGEGTRSFAVAGLKLATGGAVKLPDGFRKIGRVPGQGSSMVRDAEGKRFAIGISDGRVAIMDAGTGAFDLVDTVLDGMTDDNEQAGIAAIVWAGGTIYAADRGGAVYRIDPAAKKSTALPVGGSRSSPNPGNTLCVSRDGKWVAWLKNATTLVVMPAQGGPLREIEVKRLYRMHADEDGFRLSGQNNERYLLKNEDVAAGKPVAIDNNEGDWESDRRRTPAWSNLEFASHKPAERKSYGNDGVRTSIPTDSCYFIAPDNTLYYADKYGVVVEVKPSGKGEPADADEE